MKEGFRLYLHHTAFGGNGLCTDLQPVISLARKAGRITLLGDAVCVCVGRGDARGEARSKTGHVHTSLYLVSQQHCRGWGREGNCSKTLHIYTHTHTRTHIQSPYCPWRAIGKGRSANCTRDWLRWESQSRSPLCVCVCVSGFALEPNKHAVTQTIFSTEPAAG